MQQRTRLSLKYRSTYLAKKHSSTLDFQQKLLTLTENTAGIIFLTGLLLLEIKPEQVVFRNLFCFPLFLCCQLKSRYEKRK